MLFEDALYRFAVGDNHTHREIVTLGPAGTSSFQAANFLGDLLKAGVMLYPTYEAAAQAVEQEPKNRALLVANAYAEVNRFYISALLRPAGAFFYNTPAYVVAATNPDILNKPQIKVASHPAPSHLVGDTIQHADISIISADSTHIAAEMTAEGQVDACLTTQIAAEMLNLCVLSVAFPTIPMLWTVFISKEHSSWTSNPLSPCQMTSPPDSRPTLLR